LDQLDPGNPQYNVATALRINGPLDVEALRCALSDVVARHEVLRTSFLSEETGPRAAISETAAVALPVDDLSALSPEEATARMNRAIAQEAARPFDLARGPLLRVRIVRLNPTDHVAITVLHHSGCDGWSRAV